MLKPGERDVDEKPSKLNIAKMARLLKMSKVWQKVALVYDKVKNGQLYTQKTANHAGLQGKETGPQTRPIYHNYFTYNTSNRAAVPDWNAQLQRNQRPFYMQRNGLNGFANVPHTNLVQRGTPYWNTTNRFWEPKEKVTEWEMHVDCNVNVRMWKKTIKSKVARNVIISINY